MRSAPVGNDNSVETPFSLEDIVQKVLVMAGMLSLVKIISSHDRPCATFLHSSLECREINLVQRSVRKDCIILMPLGLLVVQSIMLHAHCDSVLLHFLHIWNHHPRSKVWILTHVLEVSSIERRTVNVHTRAKKDILLAETGLFSYGFTIKRGHVLIPCSGKTCKGRESHTRVICPSCLLPLVPKHFRTDAMRAICGPQFRDSQTRDACR